MHVSNSHDHQGSDPAVHAENSPIMHYYATPEMNSAMHRNFRSCSDSKSFIRPSQVVDDSEAGYPAIITPPAVAAEQLPGAWNSSS